MISLIQEEALMLGHPTGADKASGNTGMGTTRQKRALYIW